MKIEDTTNSFTETLILIANFFPHLKDDFFVKKLRTKMAILMRGYIKFRSWEDSADVAQYYIAEKLISDTDAILELLEVINHLRVIKETTPLLLANQSLLALKLEFVKIKNNLSVNLEKKDNNVSAVASKSDNKNQASIINAVVSQKNILQKRELNPNKEQILNFIKKSPNARTKDIIHEFNALSDRTVKRNLGELLRVGLINKKIENKAVYYSAKF